MFWQAFWIFTRIFIRIRWNLWFCMILLGPRGCFYVFKRRGGARSSLIEKEESKKVYCEREGVKERVKEERGNGLLQEGPSWVFGGFWRKEVEEGSRGLYFIICEKNRGPKLGRGFLWKKIYKLVITPKCDKEVVGEEIMKKILQISNWESFICGWKQGKVNNSLLYVKKDTSNN